MVDFRGNIEGWIKQSEPDYYLLFVKAWIPFNAWYVKEMPQHQKKDRLLIKELQDNPNSKPKQKIISLLEADDFESKYFRYHLSQLHFNLEKRKLMHNGISLSFKSLELTENPIKYSPQVDSLGNKYKAEVKSTYYEALIVDKNGKSIIHYKGPKYDIEDLKKNIHFIGLKKTSIQNKLMECFEKIDPNKPTSIISESANRKEYKIIDKDSNVKFIKNNDIISKACIKVLYSLRCMLFHGEIDPTQNNAQVYAHAYYMLKTIIKELN